MIATRTISVFSALIALTAIASSSPARAQSAETLAAADRLIVVQNLDGLMKDMAANVASRLEGASDAQKQAFIAEMTAPAFMARFRDETRNAMAKSFTTDELNALADFYSKPVAKSAMAKMGPYTADMMSFVQKEIPTMVQRILQKK